MFIEYNGLKLSASLSFYTVFSIGPLLIVIISLAGIFFGKPEVEGQVYAEIQGLLGSNTAGQIQQIIQNIQNAPHGVLGGIIGFVILIIGASGVFSEIQDSINLIWSVQTLPQKGFLQIVIKRLLSFSLLLALAFMLLVALIVNTLIDILSAHFKSNFENSVINVVYLLNTALIFITITAVFTLIFKVLPHSLIKWGEALIGALFTALLFMLGKFIIGFYLGNSKIGFTYGAAASIVILMLWVYYSSIILYYGACFTKTYASRKLLPST
jgi:membrane protein